MLLIETYLQPVQGKGIGLFTKHEVKVGENIYQDDELFCKEFSNDVVLLMSEIQQSYIKKYSTFDSIKNSWYLTLDDARFFNHSENPNTKYNNESGFVFAIKDIESGGELTANYREFDDLSKEGDFGFEIK